MFGVAYNFGQFAVGASQNQFDDKLVVTTSTTMQDHSLYGVTFAASDAINSRC